jgi:hypothetical protein
MRSTTSCVALSSIAVALAPLTVAGWWIRPRCRQRSSLCRSYLYLPRRGSRSCRGCLTPDFAACPVAGTANGPSRPPFLVGAGLIAVVPQRILRRVDRCRRRGPRSGCAASRSRERSSSSGRSGDDVPEWLKYFDAASKTAEGRAQFDNDPDARRPPARCQAIQCPSRHRDRGPGVGSTPRSAPAGWSANMQSSALAGTRPDSVAAITWLLPAASQQADGLERQWWCRWRVQVIRWSAHQEATHAGWDLLPFRPRRGAARVDSRRCRHHRRRQ